MSPDEIRLMRRLLLGDYRVDSPVDFAARKSLLKKLSARPAPFPPLPGMIYCPDDEIPY